MVLLMLSLLPLVALPWSVEFWPGQDDPNHLALAHVVQHFEDPGSTFPNFLTVKLDLTPYKLYYYVLLVLGQAMDLSTANRLVVSGVIAGLPLIVLLWLRRMAPERQINVFLISLLATSWLPLVGFHSYMMGFLLGIAALALAGGKSGAQETKEPPGWGAVAAASALLFLAAVAHPLAAVITGIALLVFEVPSRASSKAWLRVGIVGTPAALLVISAALATPPSGNVMGFIPEYSGIIPSIWFLIAGLVAFDYLELIVRGPVLVILLWGGFQAVRRFGIRGPGRDQSFARLFLVFSAVYFVTPNFLTFSFLPHRVSFFALIAAAFLPMPARILRKPGLLCWVVLFASIALAAVQYRTVSRLSDDVSDVVAAGEAVPRGVTLLPLQFDKPRAAATINPTLHAWGYLVLERDIVTAYLFSTGGNFNIAGRDWRPVFYIERFGPEFLPQIQEWIPRAWAKSREFMPETIVRLGKEYMLEIMAGYDRALLISPPEEFLEAALQAMEIEKHVGDVWVLKPDEGTE
jgi:hypothetical protein